MKVKLVKSHTPSTSTWDGKKFRKVQFPMRLTLKDGREVTIPAGYPYNGANIPRIFWFFAHPFSYWIDTAACYHDYLLEKNIFPRNDCHRIMYDIMNTHTPPRWKPFIAYWAVRITFILTGRPK